MRLIFPPQRAVSSNRAEYLSKVIVNQSWRYLESSMYIVCKWKEKIITPATKWTFSDLECVPWNICYTRLVYAKRGYSRIIFQNLEHWWQMQWTIYLAASATEYPLRPLKEKKLWGQDNQLRITGARRDEQSQQSPELCRGNCMWAKQIARFPSQLFRSPEEPQLSTPNMPDWHTRSRADALPNSRKREQKIIH